MESVERLRYRSAGDGGRSLLATLAQRCRQFRSLGFRVGFQSKQPELRVGVKVRPGEPPLRLWARLHCTLCRFWRKFKSDPSTKAATDGKLAALIELLRTFDPRLG